MIAHIKNIFWKKWSLFIQIIKKLIGELEKPLTKLNA